MAKQSSIFSIYVVPRINADAMVVRVNLVTGVSHILFGTKWLKVDDAITS